LNRKAKILIMSYFCVIRIVWINHKNHVITFKFLILTSMNFYKYGSKFNHKNHVITFKFFDFDFDELL
jgi:hypothetical protein